MFQKYPRSIFFILALPLTCIFADSPAEHAEEAPKPSIIFFIADDWSQEDLGCYGNPSIQTPNIDRLAAGGMRFDNAYLTTSSCSPTRCSIITGRYPHDTGAPELHSILPDEQIRFPELLREAVLHGSFRQEPHV